MNLQLHQQLLTDLGIELSNEEYAELSDYIDTTLVDRVINEIIDYLNDDQTEKLANLKDSNQETTWLWLTDNVPELKEIIQNEIDILLGEIAQRADEF